MNRGARDYVPVSLTAYCNAGVEIFSHERYTSGGTYLENPMPDPPIGRQSFHGLPFRIGPVRPEPGRCFIAFNHRATGEKEDPIHVPVKARVHNLIFAHSVLETRLWTGGMPGEEVAVYRFHYMDSSVVEVPIRERFEIGNIPTPWGQYPFACVPDREDHLLDRYRGEWSRFGFRITEVGWGIPRGYFLWVWQNPQPDLSVRSVEICPRRLRFCVAGITRGHVDEYPLVRTARRPVKISIHDHEMAHAPFALQVAVDRGVATYAYPLPSLDLESTLGDRMGFGLPENMASSPAYTEIAATPSATVRIHHGSKEIDAVGWGELLAQGVVDTGRTRVELVDSDRNWVRVTVRDEANGRPVPCRIAFLSANGLPYPPHGHHAPIFSNHETWNIDVGGDVKMGHMTYASINGNCEGWLPRGRVLVDVSRGFEYEPLRTWVQIVDGQQDLELSIKPWIRMNQQGYYSGDTHVHFLSAQGSENEARSEDLNVVNLLQSQWGHYYSNTEEFTGAPRISADGDTIVYVSQENRQHILGHLSLLGLKSPVAPWSSGGPNEAELGGPLEVTLSHWADAAHAQGGLVVLPHYPTPNGEPAALVATGRADAIEMLDFLSYERSEYYRLLNGGYRLPLVGGTDKMDSAVPVGLYRTYVYIPPDRGFSYETWIEGIRSGNTFLSGGPLLWFNVDGKPMGSTLKVGRGGHVAVDAFARSIFPIHCLQIIREGKVVAETTEGAGAHTLSLNCTLEVTGDTWLAARCAGPQFTAYPHFDVRKRGIMAHSSPIYITCDQEYALVHPETIEYMLTLIQGSLTYIRHHSLQSTDRSVTHSHGQPDHMAYLEQPLREAERLLHHRLHQLGIAH